jgi:hypothetical protein
MANLRAGAVLFTLIAAISLGFHYPLWNLPFYWDELGQFVPAALDIYERGAWVPVSTLPNIHPPGLMALLAGVWKLTGFSIEATRITMLLVSAVGVFLAFLLTLRLAAGAPGLPGFTTVLLLFASPLFYMQAMMAQLDMPAMVLTLAAILLFLEERLLLSVVTCAALVWVKETGAILPAVLGVFLWREGRRQEAALFAAPLLSLVPWLWLLWSKTGSPFGNREFAEFNVLYPLHPARLGLALARRFWELFLNHGYVLGAAPLALLWTRHPLFQRREWRLLLGFTVAHVLGVTLAGGAVLERYLLPVLPLLLAAYAIAWSLLGGRKGVLLPLATAAISLSGFVLPPLIPQPEENDLAMVQAVDLHRAAAEWLETRHAGARVATPWPLSDALGRPGFGYVTKEQRVLRMNGATREGLKLAAARKPDVYAHYVQDPFERSWIRERIPFLEDLRRELYQWEAPLTGREIEDALRMREEARWQNGDATMTIFVRRELWNDGKRPGNDGIPGPR